MLRLLLKSLFLLYFIFLNIIFVIVVYKYDYIIEQQENNFYNSMVTFLERVDANNDAKNATIFIGDSIVQGLCTSCITTQAINFGIGGDTTFGVLKRIKSYASLKNAQNIVISIGFNDLMRSNNEAILNNYDAILKNLPPNIPIIATAILPIDANVLKDDLITNIRITTINLAIQKLCNNYKHCYFSHSTQKLVDKKGDLKSNYHIGDGIHPNEKAYAVWKKDLKERLGESPVNNIPKLRRIFISNQGM